MMADHNNNNNNNNNASSIQNNQQQRSLLQQATYVFYIVAAYYILKSAYTIRLVAIEEFGPVIHEFDPYFNFRATEVRWWLSAGAVVCRVLVFLLPLSSCIILTLFHFPYPPY
jgi:hypothetical protein